MSDSDDDEMLQYKIILLGDGTVGKTSIAMRFTNDTFGQSYKQVALWPPARALGGRREVTALRQPLPRQADAASQPASLHARVHALCEHATRGRARALG
jgi:GTPase SAR1 family protein